ncbi:hypothetical protein BKA57DRAFT_466209 [Linnemannia elongata]|nr:hypothetical protein BKA57DRAFT_466209 [Linnemannia elongata]
MLLGFLSVLFTCSLACLLVFACFSSTTRPQDQKHDQEGKSYQRSTARRTIKKRFPTLTPSLKTNKDKRQSNIVDH